MGKLITFCSGIIPSKREVRQRGFSWLMSQSDETLPSSFDMESYLIPTEEPQASAGPSTENPASHLDNDFDFQLVVFEVYIFLSSNLHMKMITTTSFPKRSRIRSSRFLRMASSFREPPSRPCFHYRRHKPIVVVLKASVLKIPFVCQESRRTTFGAFCVSCIRCAFLIILLCFKYSSVLIMICFFFYIKKTSA